MKRTRGSSLFYNYGVSEFCGWLPNESANKSRKSYPHCIFCNALMKRIEEKNVDEKEKEIIEGIVDLLGQEQKVGTRDQVVEVEVEEISMENLLEELKRKEEETPMGEVENGNAFNGGGGENFEDGFMDLLQAEDLTAVEGILSGLDLGGWGNWHFEDDMIWREWEADWVYGYSNSYHLVTVNSDASYSWDLESYEAPLAQDWEESLWVLEDDDTQN